MKTRRAFTLVELLITALLLVVVGGYSVVIFSSTVGLTSQANRSSGAASQARQALDVLVKAYAQSTTASPVVALASSETGTEGSILIFTVVTPTSTGAISSSTEQRIYCAQAVGNGTYRLVQFTTLGVYGGGGGSVSCSAASLATVFGGTNVAGPIYLTDSATNVTRFVAIPAQYGQGAQPTAASGMRLLLTSTYDPAAGSGEQRADTGGSSHAITVEATATRNYPGGIVPFSGL